MENNEKNNIFKFATKELSQDAFICWLTNYINTEDEKYKNVAKNFIQLIAHKINDIKFQKYIDENDYEVIILRLYILELKFYDYENLGIDTESVVNVYSDFKKAKHEGLIELNQRTNYYLKDDTGKTFEKYIKEEKVDYDFTITEIDDLNYTENFNKKESKKELYSEEYLKYEPTHKIYEINYKGNINEITYEWKIKNNLNYCKKSITLYSSDFYEGAYKKFNIGDIVKVKEGALEEGYFASFDDIDKQGLKRLFVVTDVPLKRTKPIYKYCENKYKLSSFFKTNFISTGSEDIYESEFYEKDIEIFKGNVPEKYELLSKILKGEIKVDGDYMHNVEIGVETLNKENVIKNLIK